MPIPPIALQCLVAGSTQLAGLSVGAAIGYPSVLLRQLQSNDTIVHLDLDNSSWIGSLHGISGIPSIMMPFLMQCKGRKFAFILSCIFLIIGWIFTCLAQGITMIFIGECFQGLGTNSIFAVSFLSISEMVEPNYRNTCALLYGSFQAIGISLVSILGKYMHWKTVGFITSWPVLLALPMGCFWPESPSWLAYKHRFHECQQSFRRLRRTNENSQKELLALINAQQKVALMEIRRSYFEKILRTFRQRDFYMPALHSFVLINVVYWGGGMPVLIYTSDMMKQCSGKPNDEIKLIMDCVFCIGYNIAAVLVTYFSTKKVMLCSMIGSFISMCSATVVTYLQSVNVIAKSSELAVYSLLAFIVCLSLGSCCNGFSIASEIMPVKHRGIGGGLHVLYICILHSLCLKAYPYLCLYMQIWGVFLIYSVYIIFSILFIWKYIPNTKNRTLQEIEYFYNHGYFLSDVNGKDISVPFVKI